MKKSRSFVILSFLLMHSCSNNAQTAQGSGKMIDSAGMTIQERFMVPAGYRRVEEEQGSFGDWLRKLPLKANGTDVLLYNGSEKNRQDVHAAVIQMDVGMRDLQQCADAVMRLRAEYLFTTKQFDKIHFKFTSGHVADYTSWVNGYRPEIKGNQVTFTKKANADHSYKEFRNYMNTVFTYAGTLSLSRELKSVPVGSKIKAGDIFIQGGLPPEWSFNAGQLMRFE